jgi:transposase
MYRVHLTEAQREELQRRAHAPGVAPRTRDRLEMVRLASSGLSIPRIARILGISEPRVRHWIQRFLADGFDALPDQPHRGRPSALTPAIRTALKAELQKGDRTWNARQIADWVADQHGVRLSPRHLGRLLQRAKLSYKRTNRSLKHKQDPQQVAIKEADLQTLEKGEPPASWTCVTSTRRGSP